MGLSNRWDKTPSQHRTSLSGGLVAGKYKAPMMIDSDACVQAFYSERPRRTAGSLIDRVCKKNPLAETKVISTNGAGFSLSKDDEWGGMGEKLP